MTSTTAQLQLTQRGGPFKVVSVPLHTFSANQVLIRQRVIALNLIDVKQRDYGIAIASWPHVLGIEGAGVIEAVGSEVSSLHPGDEVMAWEGAGAGPGSGGGSYQERVAVPEHLVAKKPENISLEEGASLTSSFVTAVSSLVHTLKIPLPFIPNITTSGNPPASILILGGSSVVGAASIQLLRTAHPSLPILATSSPKHHQWVLDLGATAVIDYKSASVVADLKAASPGGVGVDVILDCVSAGAGQTDISDVLDPKGLKRYAALITGIPVEVPEGVNKMDATAEPIFAVEGGKGLIPSLTKLVEDGVYKVPLPVRVVGHGLEELADVMDEVKSASGEKVLVTL